MSIKTREIGDVTVIQPSGRLVIDNSIELREAVRAALESGATKIVLNLGEVTTIDSSGLGELVSSYTTASNRNAKLKLSNVPAKVNDILMITRLATVFETFATEDEAVKSFE
ncbi:STAS domain-containing protein [Nannocystis sp. ILAH1]|uniref:STAS domain-containing protein n=1 Tax=unclassified Nannocystis TaxID=2627009 RepID=UPI0022704D50|nr:MULTISPECIES: STAS domain-containing protein [unclassified Nannocystis]MCY0991209.1 STAS domain-containing protein [Nannocystis sp. ILAH1]MCY1064723.1 STAS domain-containing protein [Nannocystis sp. RBIL2]